MIVTVKDLLQNTNKEDFENLSFTRGNCSKEELKELEKKIEEKISTVVDKKKGE